MCLVQCGITALTALVIGGDGLMRVLHVIHGFPPFYMAGSEVYTRNLVEELSKHVSVTVFSRIENPFAEDYEVSEEQSNSVRVIRVNKPHRNYSLRDKYLDEQMDQVFTRILLDVAPDVVHIDHLSHLSTNIVNIISKRNIPIVYTVHDFWLFCIRGQLIRPDMTICEGPSEINCLECTQYLHTTREEIRSYRAFLDRVIDNIDVFLIPSRFLVEFFRRMGIERSRIIHSPYGFKRSLIRKQSRTYTNDSRVVFGFTGRIIPQKGIHVLLRAFKQVHGNVELRVFGETGVLRRYLESMADDRVPLHGGVRQLTD